MLKLVKSDVVFLEFLIDTPSPITNPRMWIYQALNRPSETLQETLRTAQTPEASIQ
jgi:hypothetical protein